MPPYGRAGLYKQLAVLKNLLSEYRTDPAASESLRATIVDNLSLAGLQDDCPYVDAATGAAAPLSAEQAEALPAAAFQEYAGKLYSYLQVGSRYLDRRWICAHRTAMVIVAALPRRQRTMHSLRMLCTIFLAYLYPPELYKDSLRSVRRSAPT